MVCLYEGRAVQDGGPGHLGADHGHAVLLGGGLGEEVAEGVEGEGVAAVGEHPPHRQNWSSISCSGSSRAGQAASPPGGGLAAVLGRTTTTLVTVLLGSSSVLLPEPQKYLAERKMVRRRRRLRTGLLTWSLLFMVIMASGGVARSAGDGRMKPPRNEPLFIADKNISSIVERHFDNT